MDIRGQTAVVTGASSGIGLGISRVLAERGANVAMWSRSREHLNATISDVQSAAEGATLGFEVDVREREEVEHATRATVDEWGPITLLVNCAGTPGPAGLDWEVDPAAWWECIETSVKGSYLCERTVLPAMLGAGRGRIVELVSVTGTNVFPVLDATSVAKAALIRHAENLAAATAGTGVTVFALHPGTVDTKLLASYRSDPSMAAFLDRLPADVYTEPRAVGEVVARIACGDLDALSGAFVDATADIEEQVAAREADSNEFHRMRLVDA